MKNDKTNNREKAIDLLSYPTEKIISFMDPNNGKGGYRIGDTTIIEPIYDEVDPFDENSDCAYVKVGRRYKCINKLGQTIYDGDWDQCNVSEGIALIQEAEGVSKQDCKALETLELIQDHLYAIRQQMSNLEDDGFYTLVDFDSREKILENFISDIYRQVNFKIFYRFVDIFGKEIFSERFDDASTFSEGYALVCLNGKRGFIDKSGKIAIPMIYQWGSKFRNGIASVKLNHKYGAINKKGEVVIPFIYNDYIGESHEGMIMVRSSDDKYGFVNQVGDVVIPPKYSAASSFYSGVAKVRMGDSKYYALIDKLGNELTDYKYEFKSICCDEYRNWGDNICIFKEESTYNQVINKLYGFVNNKGVEITPAKYTDAEDFQEARALVTIEDKMGFIDTDGKEITPLIYDYAKSYSCGFALVKIGSKYGYIDLSGDVAIPMQFNQAYSFVNGIAMVQRNRKNFIINTNGEVVRVLDYDKIFFDYEDMSSVRVGKKYGMIDLQGNIIIPAIYKDTRNSYGLNYSRAKVAGGWYDVDSLGNMYGSKHPY